MSQRQALIDGMERTLNKLKHGCGNHGCIIHDPPGQGTNATCQCQPVRISKALLNMAEFAESLGQKWEK